MEPNSEKPTELTVKTRLFSALAVALGICCISFVVSTIFTYFLIDVNSFPGMYAMFLPVGPIFPMLQKDLFIKFNVGLFKALFGAIVGLFIVVAATMHQPLSFLGWLGAVAGNTIGFYFSIPVILEIAKHVKERDAQPSRNQVPNNEKSSEKNL